ncbi:MAG: SpoIID/LytB domain-containing protein [Bacteroidota bacterium]
MMKSLCIGFILAVLAIGAGAQEISIRIYSTQRVRSFVLSPVDGKYRLMCDSLEICKMKRHNVILVDMIGDSIQVRSLDEKFGVYSHIELYGVGKNNYFRIKSIDPDFEPRDYDDNLHVLVMGGSLLIINDVDIENYVAGVVQSEGGINSPAEYYKSQAIICRTYTLENLFRHIQEDYNLCDDVHCQAYHGKSLRSEEITKATYDTKGLVIVDTSLSLITATYHSNCGGQTSASENVWLTSRSYLKAVTDTFCLKGRCATWTKDIPTAEWIEYLKSYGIKPDPGAYDLGNYSFYQPSRKQYYKFKNDSIAFKLIRQDLKLRSAYFDVIQQDGVVHLKGKGYGHGVGLCQEGAMEMARRGYSYEDIIYFYYKNTYIVSLRALEFFRNEE